MGQLHVLANKVCTVTVSGAAFLTMACFTPASACPVAGITNATLTPVLQAAVAAGNGGLGFPMWATVVDRDGVVCVVAKSAGPGLQWPGSPSVHAGEASLMRQHTAERSDHL